MILQLSFDFNQQQMNKKARFKKVEFFDVNKFKNWIVGDEGGKSFENNKFYVAKSYPAPRLKPKR